MESANEAAASRPAWFGRALLLALLAGAALAPLAHLITSLVANYHAAPYYDSWSFYYRLAKFIGGDASWSWYLFSQQNEARPAVPRLILFLVHCFTRDLSVEVILNVSSAVATALVTLLILRKTNPGMGWPLLLAVALLFNLNFFSLAQWQNWNWRNQFIMLLPNFFFAAGWLINLSSLRPLLRGAGISICCAAATFCFANGMFQWVLVIPLAFGLSRREQIRLWSLHGFSAIVCLAIYFIGYHSRAGHDPAAAISHPGRIATYFFSWLGSSLSGGSIPLAVGWGAILLLSFLVLAFFCFQRWRSEGLQASWLPWLAFGCYALISASLTALARSQIGLEQALRARYCSISLWLIVAIIGLSVTITRRNGRRISSGTGLLVLLAAAFLCFQARHAMVAAGEWHKFSEWMHFQEQSFGLEREHPGQLWTFHHHNRQLVLEAYSLMRKQGFLGECFHSNNILSLLTARKWGARSDGEIQAGSYLPFRQVRCLGWSVGGGPGDGNRVLVVLIFPSGKVLAVADGPIDRRRVDLERRTKFGSSELAGFDLEFELPKLELPGIYRVAAFRYARGGRSYHSIGAPRELRIPVADPARASNASRHEFEMYDEARSFARTLELAPGGGDWAKPF